MAKAKFLRWFLLAIAFAGVAAVALPRWLPGEGTLRLTDDDGTNTTEALRALPYRFSSRKPRLLIARLGDANQWNRHGLHAFLARAPLWRQVWSPRSAFFTETPLAEYPTLAMRWAGYLNARGAPPPKYAAEAKAAIERWIADPRSARSPFAAQALAGARARQVSRGENPFSAGGSPPIYDPRAGLTAEAFAARLIQAFPPAAREGAEKPGISLLDESFATEEKIAAWVRHDLTALLRFARRYGVRVVLQTYPPQRFSGNERLADRVIREVAQDSGVPLSDLASELRRRWNGRALEGFYEPRGDSLNGAGRALAEEILREDLRRFGLTD